MEGKGGIFLQNGFDVMSLVFRVRCMPRSPAKPVSGQLIIFPDCFLLQLEAVNPRKWLCSSGPSAENFPSSQALGLSPWGPKCLFQGRPVQAPSLPLEVPPVDAQGQGRALWETQQG